MYLKRNESTKEINMKNSKSIKKNKIKLKLYKSEILNKSHRQLHKFASTNFKLCDSCLNLRIQHQQTSCVAITATQNVSLCVFIVCFPPLSYVTM